MSKLLRCYSTLIIQIMILLSILLVIRGHNFPGGGFIGGLVAATANALYIYANGVPPKIFDQYSPIVCSSGVILIIISVFLGPLFHLELLQGLWVQFNFLQTNFKLGSPLVFDFGIYLIVVGSVTWLLAEFEDNKI